MDQTAEDILNGPEYFCCERLHARMKRLECLNEYDRQENLWAVNMCKGCLQYAENVAYCGDIETPGRASLHRTPPRMDIIERVEARRRAASVNKDKHVGAGLVSARKEDGMETKICKVCGENRDLDEFGKNKRASDGHINTCNSCVKPRGGDRKSVKVKSPVVEIMEAVGAKDLSPVQAGIINNGDAYRAVAMAFISRIERRVIDAVVEGLKD